MDKKQEKLACNFFLIFVTRVKCMFVAFFSLSRLLRNSDLFYYLESENQIKFLLLA